jgi:hypothetical protein
MDKDEFLEMAQAMIRQARVDYYVRTERYGPFTVEEHDLRNTFAASVGEVSAAIAAHGFAVDLHVRRARN